MSDREPPWDARAFATAFLVLFLFVWSFVESLIGKKPEASAPGTTFRAARDAGATVLPSASPSGLDSPLIPPGPVETKRDERELQNEDAK
jgi:hypothetical protein